MPRPTPFALAFALLFPLLIPVTGIAQEASTLEGVWVLEEVQAGDRVISDPAPGMFFFCEGHLAFVDVQGQASRSFANPAEPSQAEKAAAYDGFSAVAGEYEVSGDTLFGRPFVSLDPGLMKDWPENSEALARFEVVGDTARFDFLGNPLVVTFRRVDGELLPR